MLQVHAALSVCLRVLSSLLSQSQDTKLSKAFEPAVSQSFGVTLGINIGIRGKEVKDKLFSVRYMNKIPSKEGKICIAYITYTSYTRIYNKGIGDKRMMSREEFDSELQLVSVEDDEIEESDVDKIGLAFVGPSNLFERHLQQEFACSSDATLAVLAKTTMEVVKPTLSADQKLANVDTVDCTHVDGMITVVQQLDIEVLCSDSGCSATAAELEDSDVLAGGLRDAINDSVHSGLYTRLLRDNAKEYEPRCKELENATVNQTVPVIAGNVTISTLSPSQTKSPES